MNDQTVNYIYNEPIIFSYAIIAAIFYALINKKFMVHVALIVLMVRPSERYISELPLVTILFISMCISSLINIKTIYKKFKNRDDIMLLVYIMYVFVTTIIFHKTMLFESIKLVSTGFLYYVFCKSYLDNTKDCMLLNFSVLVCCLFICLEPLYYHILEGQGSVYWKYFHSSQGRIQAWGMWSNANETAFIACIGIASSLLATSEANKKILYFIPLIVIPFFVYTIYLSASRAGLLCLMAIFLPMLYLVKNKTFKIMVCLLIVLLMFLSKSYSPIRTDAQASLEERIELNYSGIYVFEQYPLFGVGFLRSRNELGGMVVHNTYLQVLLETGIIGGVIFLCYIFAYVKKVYSLNKFTNNKTYSSLIYGFLISGLMYLFVGNQLLTIMFFLIFSIISTSSMILLLDTTLTDNASHSHNSL